MQNPQEIFDKTVVPLSDSEKLELAALILRSVSAPKGSVSAYEYLKGLPERRYRSVEQAEADLRMERDLWED